VLMVTNSKHSSTGYYRFSDLDRVMKIVHAMTVRRFNASGNEMRITIEYDQMNG